MLSLSAVRDRPSLLKLDLYCRGLLVDDSCLVGDDGGRQSALVPAWAAVLN